MRFRYFWLLSFTLLLLFSGCREPEANKTESALIVWKTPSLRYADMGFISERSGGLDIEIYDSGKAVMRLKVDREAVCTGAYRCMSKHRFNQKFLSGGYPDDTLERIFRGEKIFAGLGLLEKRNGFTQKIEKAGCCRIDYRVFNNQIIFRDTINQIFIKVKRQ